MTGGRKGEGLQITSFVSLEKAGRTADSLVYHGQQAHHKTTSHIQATTQKAWGRPTCPSHPHQERANREPLSAPTRNGRKGQHAVDTMAG